MKIDIRETLVKNTNFLQNVDYFVLILIPDKLQNWCF